MKVIALGVIGFVPLATQAAVITLVNFIGDTSTPLSTSTVTDGFAVPIGTNGAETTYLFNGPETTVIETTVNGAASTTTQTTSAAVTLVASASGYKMNGVGGFADSVECRYTGKDEGECVLAAGTGTEAQTVTVSGPPIDVIILPVSETGAAGAAPTAGNGNGTSSGNQNGGNGGNGAVGLSTGKQLMLTIGGVVLGALAIL
ncbi:hypothetical protein AAF712_011364 [Marasmius tenuissimus]|uniref:Uncharacterized protein n=1 Tax=Marasmius tenuissimus TaxID=585030 RepID=A0ABR2ZJC1_9AGAR|nr:hypothetical protein PM082_011652 [Marasmius tenuissimus]